MRSCVILGSGRSGTSMLAGMLHSAGYYMGDQLLPPTSSNPRGYFEDRTINKLNEDLLVQLRPVRPVGRRHKLYPWRLAYGHYWLAALNLNTTVRATPEMVSKMRNIASRRPFCFKDPRFCYTLGAWRPMLGDAAFLCVFREPGRTATSMITDSHEQAYLTEIKLTRRRALRAWTSMYRHVLEKHRQEGQWLFIHYDQILDGSAISKIESFIEADIDVGFVDASLKRSQNSGRLPRRTSQIYQRLCALAGASSARSSLYRSSTS
jgi:Sulfotransferase family